MARQTTVNPEEETVTGAVTDIREVTAVIAANAKGELVKVVQCLFTNLQAALAATTEDCYEPFLPVIVTVPLNHPVTKKDGSGREITAATGDLMTPWAAPVILPAPALEKGRRWYLGACAIVRDELDLPEWVAYQFAVGVQHIHIFDNESVIPVADRLPKWIADGKVSVTRVWGRRMQNECYTRYLTESQSRRTAFIDIDEFLLPYGTDDLKNILPPYEQYGGLGVCWHVFGCNGHARRPRGLVIENYLKRGPITFDIYGMGNPQYKTIVQTKKAAACGNPHFFEYRPGWRAVNDAGVKMPSRTHGPASAQVIPLNHYMCKSLEDWRLKQERRGGASGRARTDDHWQMIQAECNSIEDRKIQRFVPKVKELLAAYA